jgi:hypothetical protein
VTCRRELTLRIGLTNAKDNLERVARKAVAEAKASHDRHRATCLECSQ